MKEWRDDWHKPGQDTVDLEPNSEVSPDMDALAGLSTADLGIDFSALDDWTIPEQNFGGDVESAMYENPVSI